MNYFRLPNAPGWMLVSGATAGLSLVSSGAEMVRNTSSISGISTHQTEARYGDSFEARHDHILGTSLDMVLKGVSWEAAFACERAMLAEIDRLGRIFSTYDPASEISRLKKNDAVLSNELKGLFSWYEVWCERTQGALNLNMGGVIDAWRKAAAEDRPPSQEVLDAAFEKPFSFNVDALGKAHIVDLLVEFAQKRVPSGLLNIGGDIRVWGEAAWTVGVCDPLNPAENAPVLTSYTLRNAAIATSGGYARDYNIGGQRYSHIIDPRTRWPIDPDASATAVAADCLTANALTTTTCLLGRQTGEHLAKSWDPSAHLVFATSRGDAVDGAFRGTVPLAVTNVVAGNDSAHANASSVWPKGFQVTVNLSLKSGGKRPYVAVWAVDSKGTVVRTIEVWGGKRRYFPSLTDWSAAVNSNYDAFQSVTRATRQAGQYKIIWDGLDDKGSPLPRGDYTLYLEINREHGHRVAQATKIVCGPKLQTFPLTATAESDPSVIKYGPKEL